MPAYHAHAAQRPLQPALPKGSLVVITGATGFIGSHTASALLAHPNNYRIRCPVRSEEKAAGLTSYVEKHFGKGRLETPLVKDMAAPGAYEGIIDDDVKGVIHLATDVSFGETWEVIENSKAGIENLLHTISKHPSVTRLVLTSSSVALGQPSSVPRSKFDPAHPAKVWDHDTWDDEMPTFARQQADKQAKGEETDKTPGKLPMAMYATSKILSERAAWEWLEDTKRSNNLTFTTVHPNATLGEPILPKGAASIPGEWLWSLYKGETATYDSASPQHFCNVRDIAKAHVAAIARDDVGNERILGFTGPFGWSDCTRVLIRDFPDKKGIIAAPKEGDEDTIDATLVKNARFKELCGGSLIGFEESVRETIQGQIKSGAKQDTKA
ncbi:NAD(P)-binding protein [Jaminaea rosea]|uniref:NAD(P)-binding protein n=1 Tax=Jaminaea rosea TaxID=1569628 RepID=A0A316ULN3_9BASI|nr:NAD(P)-binding protein [Jaminaea rosea]PWN25854.1 NAD(P)-binding protein [Jaminaea rosea]